MRDLRDERIRRSGVREERLRSTAGLRGSMALSSWRGRSGRRYVVGIHPLTEAGELDVTDAVILAVRRDADGFAHILALADAGSRPVAQAAWVTGAGQRGATELHVHRLAEDEAERLRIIADLQGQETEA